MKDAFHEQFAKKLIIYRILLNALFTNCNQSLFNKEDDSSDKKDSGFEITTKLVPFHSLNYRLLELQIYQNFS
jgi:hypothetical protein